MYDVDSTTWIFIMRLLSRGLSQVDSYGPGLLEWPSNSTIGWVFRNGGGDGESVTVAVGACIWGGCSRKMVAVTIGDQIEIMYELCDNCLLWLKSLQCQRLIVQQPLHKKFLSTSLLCLWGLHLISYATRWSSFDDFSFNSESVNFIFSLTLN